MAAGQIVSVEPLSGLMLLAAIGAAMVGSLFASDAWYTVTYIAGEVKNPKRNIPLSLVLGAGIVILLYFLANVAYVVTLPVHGSPDAADVIGPGHPVRPVRPRRDRGGRDDLRRPGGRHHGRADHDLDLRLQQRPHPVRRPRLLRHGQGRAVLQVDGRR